MLSGVEAGFHVACLSSGCLDKAGAVKMSREEGRDCPRRPGREEADELICLFDCLQGQGGVDSNRQAFAKGKQPLGSFAGAGRSKYPLRFVESGSKVAFGEGQDAHPVTMGDLCLERCALCRRLEVEEVLAGALD